MARKGGKSLDTKLFQFNLLIRIRIRETREKKPRWKIGNISATI